MTHFFKDKSENWHRLESFDYFKIHSYSETEFCIFGYRQTSMFELFEFKTLKETEEKLESIISKFDIAKMPKANGFSHYYGTAHE